MFSALRLCQRSVRSPSGIQRSKLQDCCSPIVFCFKSLCRFACLLHLWSAGCLTRLQTTFADSAGVTWTQQGVGVSPSNTTWWSIPPMMYLPATSFVALIHTTTVGLFRRAGGVHLFEVFHLLMKTRSSETPRKRKKYYVCTNCVASCTPQEQCALYVHRWLYGYVLVTSFVDFPCARATPFRCMKCRFG